MWSCRKNYYVKFIIRDWFFSPKNQSFVEQILSVCQRNGIILWLGLLDWLEWPLTHWPLKSPHALLSAICWKWQKGSIYMQQNQYGENGGSYLLGGRAPDVDLARLAQSHQKIRSFSKVSRTWWYLVEGKEKREFCSEAFKGVDLYVPLPLKPFPKILANNCQHSQQDCIFSPSDILCE